MHLYITPLNMEVDSDARKQRKVIGWLGFTLYGLSDYLKNETNTFYVPVNMFYFFHSSRSFPPPLHIYAYEYT